MPKLPRYSNIKLKSKMGLSLNFKRTIAKAMKDDTEFGQNFRSAVNGFLTKINRMAKARRIS